MHPNKPGTTLIASASGGPNVTIGGKDAPGGAPASAPSTPAAPVNSPNSSWAMWLFHLLLGK
jgi:hypothetical protein